MYYLQEVAVVRWFNSVCTINNIVKLVPGHKGGGGGEGYIWHLIFPKLWSDMINLRSVGRILLHKVGWALGNGSADFHYHPVQWLLHSAWIVNNHLLVIKHNQYHTIILCCLCTEASTLNLSKCTLWHTSTCTFSSLIRILLVSTTNLSISASLLSLNSLNLLLDAPDHKTKYFVSHIKSVMYSHQMS